MVDFASASLRFKADPGGDTPHHLEITFRETLRSDPAEGRAKDGRGSGGLLYVSILAGRDEPDAELRDLHLRGTDQLFRNMHQNG